jgi:hypothetical protein
MPVGVVQVGGENSGMAIASLTLGIIGLVGGFCTYDVTAIASLLAIIFGHIALSQINKSGGMIGGKGMAIAGLIMGYLVIVGSIIAIIGIIALFSSTSTQY